LWRIGLAAAGDGEELFLELRGDWRHALRMDVIATESDGVISTAVPTKENFVSDARAYRHGKYMFLDGMRRSL